MTYNRGIWHAVFVHGQPTLCGNRRAIMATTVDKFRTADAKCARCERKLTAYDARKQSSSAAEVR